MYARVQNASGGADAASLTVALGTTPTSGNLLVAWANSANATSQGGTGWTAGPSVISGNSTYTWWKVAGANEPAALTFTPSASGYICAGILEYSGNTAAPLDAASSSTYSGTAVSSTTAVTVTTTAGHDLGIAFGMLHDTTPAAAAPTAPAWTGGWTNVQAQGATAGSYGVYSFVGDSLDLGTAGTVSTAVSWSTNTWPDAQQLLLTFAAAPHETLWQISRPSSRWQFGVPVVT